MIGLIEALVDMHNAAVPRDGSGGTGECVGVLLERMRIARVASCVLEELSA